MYFVEHVRFHFKNPKEEIYEVSNNLINFCYNDVFSFYRHDISLGAEFQTVENKEEQSCKEDVITLFP